MVQKVYTGRHSEMVPIKSYDGTKIMRHDRYHPTNVAVFAMSLIDRHCGITVQVNGEDSAGRSKLRRDTPKEIVDYCCDVAEAAFSEFSSRGWLVEIPDWNTVESEANEKRYR